MECGDWGMHELKERREGGSGGRGADFAKSGAAYFGVLKSSRAISSPLAASCSSLHCAISPINHVPFVVGTPPPPRLPCPCCSPPPRHAAPPPLLLAHSLTQATHPHHSPLLRSLPCSYSSSSSCFSQPPPPGSRQHVRPSTRACLPPPLPRRSTLP